jgi:hypothetical protein
MDDMSDRQLDLALRTGGSGALDPENGLASIYFTDWLGNQITSQHQLDALKADPVQGKLNEAWTQYKGAGGNLTRDDFFKELGGQDLDTAKSAKELADSLMSPAALVARKDIELLSELAARPNWWPQQAIVQTNVPYRGQNNLGFSRGRVVLDNYAPVYTPGALVQTADGKKYAVADSPGGVVNVSHADNTWPSDNQWVVKVMVYDLDTPGAAPQWVELHRHLSTK